MAWTPANSVINARAIAENLLTYFEANQVDALSWANGGTGLLPFQRFENSVGNRNSPLFPAILFSDDNDAVDYAQTAPIGAYSVLFLVLIENQDANTAVTQARKYAVAIASMIRNCPPSTYAAGTGANANSSTIQSMEIGFDDIKANDEQNDFLQQFEIRITYQLHGGI